jgi:hypothetical protein
VRNCDMRASAFEILYGFRMIHSETYSVRAEIRPAPKRFPRDPFPRELRSDLAETVLFGDAKWRRRGGEGHHHFVIGNRATKRPLARW